MTTPVTAQGKNQLNVDLSAVSLLLHFRKNAVGMGGGKKKVKPAKNASAKIFIYYQ